MGTPTPGLTPPDTQQQQQQQQQQQHNERTDLSYNQVISFNVTGLVDWIK